MVVHLYRQSILNIFTEIRNDTAQKKLNVNLSSEQICSRKTRRSIQVQTDASSLSTVELQIPLKQSKRKHLRNIRVQTDVIDSTVSDSVDDIPISLEERIRMFEKHFREEDRKRMHNFSQVLPEKKTEESIQLKENRKRRHSVISLEIPSPHSSVDSSIPKSIEVDSLIDSCTGCDALPATKGIVETPLASFTTPINNCITADDKIAQNLQALFGDEEETDIFGEIVNPMVRPVEAIQCSETIIDHLEQPHVEYYKNATSQLNAYIKTSYDYTQELKNSIWPCELHMQRIKLNLVLMEKADKGCRYSEKLKTKFDDLFGPEDDDDYNSFAPYR